MKTLPPLREEITLLPGPMAQDGAPTWNLFDPSRNCFFRINWQAFEILSRWDLGDVDQIVARIQQETTLHTTAEDIQQLVYFFAGNHLLSVRGKTDSERLMKSSKAYEQSLGQWLLHNYLFFRIPLFRPDGWLASVVPYYNRLFSRNFILLTCWVAFISILLLLRQWDVFIHSLAETISWNGFLHYMLAIVITKGAHELSHALMAKKFGCRVPTMGIAFMVLLPVPYTDTTDSWKLVSRRQRVLVGSAGILAELTIAAYATLLWVVLPDGHIRSIAFILATTTWISTLLVNLSPFMRFDGYFILMDWLDMPNLHTRSFAMARWALRELLFRPAIPPPEEASLAIRRWLILMAVATWIYRLILFLGIAVLVYEFSFKLLGIFLFIVEIAWFVLLPVQKEIQHWWKMRESILSQPRSRFTFIMAIFLLIIFFVPWYSRITVPAILQAREHVVLYTLKPGQVVTLHKKQGDWVQEGELVVTLTSPDLAYQLVQVQNRIKLLEWEIANMGFETTFREKVQSLEQELQGAVAERIGLQQEEAKLKIKAPITGRLTDVTPELHERQWIPAKERLATILGHTENQGPHYRSFDGCHSGIT
ncbi:MAG: biotin/lipoyl-binding protein [Magnetococcales bacterium]|nr:biotin/lipoyl-binding protein [Magnetococcales bacterium]